MDDKTMLDLITQVGTAGGFGGLVWYLIAKVLPDMTNRFMEAIDKVERRYATLHEIQSEEAKQSRQLFADQLIKQRDDFRLELREILNGGKT